MDTTSMPDNIPTIIFDDSPRVRATDPLTSHQAADKTSKKRVPAKLVIFQVLEASNKPLTSDQVWRNLRNNLGYFCSKERVRTVLNEGAGLSKRTSVRFHSFVRLEETGLSDLKNPAHLWTLAGGEA